MAWIIGDSFDFYAVINDAAVGHWDSLNNTYVDLSVGTTRFGVGKSIVRSSGSTSTAGLVKAFGSNEATVFSAFAIKQVSSLTGTSVGFAVTLRDGSTNQCSVIFRSDGAILLTSGGPAGSTLATYSSAFVQNVWAHFQVKVVINNTTGSITVRRDGAASDSFSATSLNTRGGTTNNYANAVATFFGDGVLAQYVDDLLVYSSSGAAPNTWVGDIRAVQLMASADTAQKQFSCLSPVIDVSSTSVAYTRSLSANHVYWAPEFTADITGTVSAVTANFNSSMTGNIKAALYASSVSPGALLATSNAVTNPGVGLNNFTFASPPSITLGSTYMIAYLSDTAWVSKSSSGVGNTYDQSQSYASGFPNPASSTLNSASPFYGTATITPTVNAQFVDELVQDGDTSYVYDSTNGHEDLYDLDNLAATPTSIIAVQSRMFAKKSDSGARNGQIRVKSGATEVGGTDTALSTTYTWLNRVDAVDPNTSSAWTAAAVNALQVGPKVTA